MTERLYIAFKSATNNDHDKRWFFFSFFVYYTANKEQMMQIDGLDETSPKQYVFDKTIEL